jgi:mRNA interferase MazF
MAYAPEQGHAIWLTFDPQAGHEQAGRRPAVVLTPAAYNQRVGLLLACPVTTQVKGYPLSRCHRIFPSRVSRFPIK